MTKLSASNKKTAKKTKNLASPRPKRLASASKAMKKNVRTPGKGSFVMRVTKWLVVLCIWMMVAFSAVISYYAVTLPDTDKLTDPRAYGSVRILDRYGNFLAERGQKHEGVVSWDAVPAHLVEAILATEDRHFYYHVGFDPIGLSSYATFKGILAVPRLWFQSFMPLSFPQESLINLLPESFQLVVAIILGLFIVILAIKMRWSALTFGGLIVGVLVVVAWWLTLHFGADDFDPMPPASFSFVVPTAEGLVYIMLASGVAPTFATALVGGTMLGAFGSAILGKSFTWQSFAHTKDHMRYFLGSVLMGIGGVLALGCTTGQAITGMGTLSPWSLLATITMLLSGYLTQRWFLGQNDQRW